LVLFTQALRKIIGSNNRDQDQIRGNIAKRDSYHSFHILAFSVREASLPPHIHYALHPHLVTRGRGGGKKR
jgi:hypothetical protein